MCTEILKVWFTKTKKNHKSEKKCVEETGSVADAISKSTTPDPDPNPVRILSADFPTHLNTDTPVLSLVAIILSI